MKPISLNWIGTLAAAGLLAACLPSVAQQPTDPIGTPPTATSPQATAASQASAPSDPAGKAPMQWKPVSGELQGKLDAKTAKVGDAVVVKTTAKATTADGTEIPKGAKLMGKVTDVQAHDAANANSRLAVQFDHAELKGGKTLPIQSTIESLQAPVDASANSMEMMGSPGMSAGPAGGGTTGNHPGMSAANSGAPTQSTNMPTAGDSAAMNGAQSGGATANAGSAVIQLPGTNKTVTAHATGVPGVWLAPEASGPASGMLLASKKNVHLDEGTKIVLGVAVITAGTSGQ